MNSIGGDISHELDLPLPGEYMDMTHSVVARRYKQDRFMSQALKFREQGTTDVVRQAVTLHDDVLPQGIEIVHGGLLRRQLRTGPELHSVLLGAGDAFCRALLDEVALEADGSEHVEQQAPGRRTGVDMLVEHDQVDLLGRDLRRDLGEVEYRAGETIEPRHHELVT